MILNLIFVIYFHMGVAGVAIATDISQLISCVLVLRVLVRSEGSYRQEIRKLRINFDIFVKIVQIGLPAAIPYFLCGMGASTVPMILSIIGTVGTRIVWTYGILPTP